MNDRQQDTDLRARFEGQRQADASAAPPFADVMARARAEADVVPRATSPRNTWRRIAYASGLAAAAVIGMLLAIPGATSNEDAFEQAVRAYQNGPAAGAWQSPTDGLLDVPGSQLISNVPSLGVN